MSGRIFAKLTLIGSSLLFIGCIQGQGALHSAIPGGQQSEFASNTPPVQGSADGAMMYSQYCASCHNALATSTKLGRTAAQISGGIATVPNMKGLNFLTAAQVSAIATALAPVSNNITIAGAASGLRPLTVREYDASMAVLVKDTSKPGTRLLPADTISPFDNLIENQFISEGKVQQFEQAAEEVSRALIADDTRLRSVIPCVPASTTDQNCYRMIVEKLGLIIFRRPVTAAEITTLTSAIQTFATRGGSYKAGLDVFFRYALQHPDFVYRWEHGVPMNANMVEFDLNDYELATKLSFTILGETPSAELMAAAQAGKLSNATELASIVDGMLQNPKFLDQMDTFISMWLGFSKFSSASDQLVKDMRAETKALLKRVILDENLAWTNLFTFDQTFVTPALANHYQFTAPASPAWVKYADNRRRGILAHASFLSLGEKDGDTSTTQRGYFLRKNLFCEKIGPPPEDVDVLQGQIDNVNSRCKEAKMYGSVLKQGTNCIGCHSQMDPIAFGLEQFDHRGRFRTVQADAPECTITGNGDVFGYGKFNGPAELATLAIYSGRAELCLVERWLNFVGGTKVDPEIDSLRLNVQDEFKKHGKIKTLVRNTVLAGVFKKRRTLEYTPVITPIVLLGTQMTPSTGAVQGDVFNLFTNGTLSGTASIVTAGTYKVQVEAYGSPQGGVYPIMQVLVDDQLKQTFDVNSEMLKTYEVSNLQLSVGARKITVKFTNDAAAGAEDRNLYVKKVTIQP